MKPSKTVDSYWVWASSKEVNIDKINITKVGKWLIFVPVVDLDSKWELIKRMTQDGHLGPLSKASTAKPNPNARDVNIKVICVYTANWTDKEDVMRVRNALREVGFTDKLSYKSDEDTRLGKYSKNGDRGFAKYYE